jgi:hypothetical protein
MITVRAAEQREGWVCEVALDQAGESTHHTVTVTPGDLKRWGGGTSREDVEDLVGRSFDFLLEREPPSSILRRFDLSVIPRYFPEYDAAFSQPRRPKTG